MPGCQTRSIMSQIRSIMNQIKSDHIAQHTCVCVLYNGGFTKHRMLYYSVHTTHLSDLSSVVYESWFTSLLSASISDCMRVVSATNRLLRCCR